MKPTEAFDSLVLIATTRTLPGVPGAALGKLTAEERCALRDLKSAEVGDVRIARGATV